MLPSYLPSPTISAFKLGPLSIHFYALCILSGIIVAIWLTDRRWVKRGVESGKVLDVALWAVPFGIVGGRIYHVITDPELYFLPGKDPWKAFAIWDGGLGIWGAVALGAVGAWIGCRRAGVTLGSFADAVAPGLLFAQALGRLGNWFNNELYGDPTTLPWGLTIHEMDPSTGLAVVGADGQAVVLGHFQPTFLYEAVWSTIGGFVILYLARRFRLPRGVEFSLYVMIYTAGRFVVELMRSDYANLILGLRVNTWVSGLCFLGGLIGLIVSLRRGYHEPEPAAAAESEADSGEAGGTPEAEAAEPKALEPGTAEEPTTAGEDSAPSSPKRTEAD